ncbi:MAG: hypothetical protein L6R45_12005 [Anaerolineae bacterium]|nr:hypothetical protein [Anaerolineae bacterium]
MGTYDPKQILSDYANGNITVEMAMGHALQHLDKLYELQTVANLNRYELRGRVDTLENRLNSLQAKFDRLMAGMENSPPRSPGQ